MNSILWCMLRYGLIHDLGKGGGGGGGATAVFVQTDITRALLRLERTMNSLGH